MKIKDFLVGDVGDSRQLLPVNEPIEGTVPLQHSFSKGSEVLQKLPIARKCLGYIADTINETTPQIIDRNGKVLHGEFDLPEFIYQPSAEYVFEEFVQQATWALHTDGLLRVLGTVTPKNQPVNMYVGSQSLTTLQLGDGQLVYVDQPVWGDERYNIIANKVALRRRLTAPGKPRGLGDFEPAQTLFSAALFAQESVEKFFGSNMFLDVIFSLDDEFSKNAAKELMTQLARKHTGPRNSFRPIIARKKWKVDRLKESNQANQLLELMMWLNSSISTTVFGIDPLVFALSSASTSGTSLTYQNASNLRSQVWLQACKPVARLIAGCITDYLPSGQFFQFSAQDFLRGSPADRGQLVQAMALAGKHYGKPIFSLEEIREVLGFHGALPKELEEATPEMIDEINSAMENVMNGNGLEPEMAMN